MIKISLFTQVLLCLAAQPSSAFEPFKHPVRAASFWQSTMKGAIDSKIIQKAPAEMIDYLTQDNRSNGWPNTPKAVVLQGDFKNDLQAAIREIPEDIGRKVNEKLVGIFLVSDLGGSAYTEYVINEKGQEVAGFVVIDVTAMNRTANQWATWKESSPFKLANDTNLSAIIENQANDNRKNAIQYILLHEFGHILNIGSPLLPKWGLNPRDLQILPSMRFFSSSWKIVENQFISRFDEGWPHREKVHYYSSPDRQLNGLAVLENYKELLKTNFPTMYAATNPGDDFAETFVNYVHVVRLKKPWSVSISSGSENLVVHDCWQEERCREKKIIIEEVVASQTHK